MPDWMWGWRSILSSPVQGDVPPAATGGSLTKGGWTQRRPLLKGLLPPLALIVIVLGSILAGAATPTEAAGVGAMGALLLAGGEHGKRHALPHSRVMIHQPLGGFQGQATDIEIHAKEILLIREKLNMILARHTGQDL